MKSPIPEWLQKEVAEYDVDIVQPPATILDLGANIGAFSLHYAAKWPAAKISAYEPVPENCRALIGNLKEKFEAGGIAIFQAAVRAKGGDSEIFAGDNFCTHSFHQRGRQTLNKITVAVHAAAGIRSHELVKLDTEGCELEILENLDLSKTRAVVVEYHSVADKLKIAERLRKWGFSLLQEIPGSAEHGVLKFAADPGVTLPQIVNRKSPIVNPVKVYFACAGHYALNDFIFVQSVLAAVHAPLVSMAFGWVCDPSVSRARNILTANFLETDCTHLLFVDADIAFSPADIARISSHAEPVVGGLYPLKNTKPAVEWCGNGLDTPAPDRADGLRQVKYIGTGFLCIRRDAFERMIENDGAGLRYRQDFPPHRTEYAFWRDSVRKGRFLTEDWTFCDAWNDLGGKVFADTQVVLRHAGRAEWPLPLQTGNPFAKTETLKTES